MAKHITGSVSRLEGALTRLGVHTTLLNEPLSIELAGMNLRDLLGKHAESMEQQRPLTGSRDLLKERILMRVCSHFQVTEKDICSKRRPGSAQGPSGNHLSFQGNHHDVPFRNGSFFWQNPLHDPQFPKKGLPEDEV